MNFKVVLFEDQTVEYVSENWLVGRTQCWWPSCSMSEVSRLRSRHAAASDSWEKHQCRILANANTESEARCKLKKAEDGLETGFTTDTDQPARRNRSSLPSMKDLIDGKKSDEHEHRSTPKTRRLRQRSESSSSSESENGFDAPQLPDAQNQESLDDLVIGNTGEGQINQLSEPNYSPSTPAGSISQDTEFINKSTPATSSNAQDPDLNCSALPPGVSRLVLREIAALREECAEMRRMLGVLTARKKLQLQLPVPLPCQPENLKKLMEFLEDDVHLEGLQKQLSSAGGSDVSDITRRIMRRLLLPDAAKLYSFTGRLGKKSAFRACRLWPLVCGAVHASVNTTDAEIEKAVKDALKHSGDLQRSHYKKSLP